MPHSKTTTQTSSFKNTYLKLYKNGLKIVPLKNKSSKKYLSDTYLSDMNPTKPIYWNIIHNCWFTSKDNTDYLLKNGSKWQSKSIKSTSSFKSSEEESMDFTNTFLKLYKEGLKIVPSNSYTFDPVSDMSRTKPIYWNVNHNCWFTSKDNINYLVENGSQWWSKSTSSSKSSEEDSMDFTNTFLKLYKEGLKIVPSNSYTFDPVSDMSRTKPVFWNTNHNCWFTSKDNTDYLVENGSQWWSKSISV